MGYLGFAFLLSAWSVEAFHPQSLPSALRSRVHLFPSLKNTFQDHLDTDLVERLETKFSVVEPNEVQDQALRSYFDHSCKDIILCAQTGSGKTLTFLLLVIQALRNHNKTRALVLAPTELLLEQHQSVVKALDASVMDRVDFASLSQHSPIATSNNYAIIAMDEIDAVLYGESEMDEATELTSIGQQVLQEVSTERVLGTTAFLSNAHQGALLERDLPGVTLLREQGVSSSLTQVLVPTLRQKFKYFSGNRIDKLVDVLQDASQDAWLSQGSTMIFCGNVDQAEQVFVRLNTEAISTDLTISLIHEQLDKQDVDTLMMQLQAEGSTLESSETTILVCTDLAARGVDLPNVRHVILHSVPTTTSSFIHQVGRTARKGKDGLLTCLVCTASGDAQKYTHLHSLKAASSLSFHST